MMKLITDKGKKFEEITDIEMSNLSLPFIIY